MPRARPAHWELTRRFRRGAFGWKSPPAIQRVRQAVSEIKTVARRDGKDAGFLPNFSAGEPSPRGTAPHLDHAPESPGSVATVPVIVPATTRKAPITGPREPNSKEKTPRQVCNLPRGSVIRYGLEGRCSIQLSYRRGK